MCYPGVQPGQRSYVPDELRAELGVGVFVNGFAGWHLLVGVDPLRTYCNMGFGGMLPTHGATAVPEGGHACPTCGYESQRLKHASASK